MFEPSELKIVIETLTKRRTWLQKTINDPQLTADVKRNHIDILKTIDSSLQKLNKLSSAIKTINLASLTKRTQITASNARILVAEDNAEACELVTNILTDAGFKLIDTAEDGITAFDKIKNADEPFDLILCDWDMPELSGLDIHTKAKASNTLKGAYFVMVTANSEAASIRKAIQQGVNDYIVKPINAEILVNKIKVALNLEAPPEQAQA